MRAEGITSQITLLDIVESAEFNILGSRYLNIEKKNDCKIVFDSIYADVTNRDFVPFENMLFAELTNQIAEEIKLGKSGEALKNLERLVKSYDEKIASMPSRKGVTLEELITQVGANPYLVGVGAIVYLFMLLLFMRTRSASRVIKALLNK